MRLYNCKRNAQARSIEFNLSKGDIEWVLVCPLLDIILEYDQRFCTKDNSPSVDRIDSTKGYTKDNVWVISSKANRMKNDASNQELLTFSKNILRRFNES